MTMRTECFQPALLNPVTAKAPVSDAIVMSRGVCRTAGVIGSAYVEMGGSKVACYVFAPKPSSKVITGFENGAIECEVSFATHIPQEDADIAQARSRRLAQKLIDTVTPVVFLDRYPKSTIYISAMVIQSSEFDLCGLLNCCSLALCDGAVELRDVLSAYCMLLPNSKASNEQYISLACMSKLDEVTGLETVGKLSTAQLVAAVEQAKSRCAAVREIIVSKLK